MRGRRRRAADVRGDRLASAATTWELVPRLRDFAAAVGAAASAEQLRDVIHGAIQPFGARHFAMLWRIEQVPALNALAGLSSYPADWLEFVAANRLYHDDAVLAAARVSSVGFHWSDVGRIVSLGPRQANVIELASRRGFRSGYTVPLHLPGEVPSSMSFVEGGAFVEGFDIAAHWISVTAFEALRRIVRQSRGQYVGLVGLSGRQFDCVLWTCRGKSKRDIGTILGIGEETVRTHLKIAMRKLGVSDTVQLTARALRDGVISFNDILG
jgi:LuxR family quorum-sensing system transcriptional regulator CciR